MEERRIPCSQCSVEMRIWVSEANFGKTVENTCPRCGAKCTTKIIDQARVKILAEKLNEIVSEALSSRRDDAMAVIHEINRLGCVVDFEFLGVIMENPDLATSFTEVPPKVVNDKVVENVYNKQDTDWLHELKISLK